MQFVGLHYTIILNLRDRGFHPAQTKCERLSLNVLAPSELNEMINKQKYAVQHNTLMSRHTELHVSVRMGHHQGVLLQQFKNIGTFEHAVILLVRSH